MRRKIGLCLLGGIVLAVIMGGWAMNSAFSSASKDAGEITFEVAQGIGVRGLADALEEEGLIKSPLVFYVASFLTGRWSSVQAGSYSIPQNATPMQILYMVSTGDIVDSRTRVTLIEGWTAAQMAEELEEAGVVTAEEYLAVVESREGLQSDVLQLIPEGETLEGFLFPDTYLFYADATAQDVVRKQLDTFENKVYLPYGSDFMEDDASAFDIVTLASIVEREVAPDGDRERVAGIFWNRLDINQALQSDATVNYVTGKGLAAPTFEDTRTESPYNTYLYPGLPPGPISNPSVSAITATLNSEATDYLYFLTDEVGNAYYAETFEQHKANKAEHLQ